MENDALPKDAQPIERRLATILMADVANYSRMMGENEERTVQVFRGHRQVFDELLRLHRGRIFNTPGDAVLAEFPSAVEAVRCATEIQAALHTRNEHLPAEQRMLFRIGINLGDVIVQGGDLLGDGVNVAARIQSITEPGGICISGSVYDQIQNKLMLQFKQLGERSFKNIAQPIRTFSISGSDAAALPSVGARRRYGGMGLRVVVAVAILVALGVGYAVYRGHEASVADAWPSSFSTELARAKGTISPEGAVDLVLVGSNPKNGGPLPGSVSGRWANNTITASGAWSNGAPINATWTRAMRRSATVAWRPL